MHWPDSVVPIEETMRAFDDWFKVGKCVIELPTMPWTMKSLMVSKYEKLARFESIQNNFLSSMCDLLKPEHCFEENLASPILTVGGGVLSGKYNQDIHAQEI